MTPLRVLVADDDPMNLRIAARLLRTLGHHGALVDNGNKALRLIDEQHFDLMLLDINMPQLNGEETLRSLRGQEQAHGRPRLPVLMVSGHTDDGTRQHFLNAGADGFLTKPLAAEDLQQEIGSLVRRFR